ncbi:MAG: uroporphyrinogen decarboxylase family protein [Phascolarctobacterium sp.]
MTQNKKELVLAALNNEPVDRVPVGFWFHFTDVSERQLGLKNPEIVEKVVAGHYKFYDSFKPDFVKIMSDGFFGYPAEQLRNIQSLADVAALQPLGPSHPWIQGQVELVKKLTQRFGQEVLTFYNIFAPVKYLRLLQKQNENKLVAKLIVEEPEALRRVLDVIAEDIATLSKLVITEGGADGIYFSVQNIPEPEVTKERYDTIIKPGELTILAAANSVSANNILHICGFHGNRNDISWYVDYPAKAINWAVNVEEIPLAEGKELFGGRAVLGGFDNTETSYIYKGTKEQVEAFTEGIIKGAGRKGVILGADCTVPNDIDVARLEWVRAKAATL